MSNIAYEPHPVSPERKTELRAAGFTIVDAIYAPRPLGGPAVHPLAPAADDALPRAAKGPGGRWYVKRGKDVISGPYGSEDEANAAAERE